ncbi:hypothetical protein Hanom_Chr16g01461531 [Helianthus anomalus]
MKGIPHKCQNTSMLMSVCQRWQDERFGLWVKTSIVFKQVICCTGWAGFLTNTFLSVFQIFLLIINGVKCHFNPCGLGHFVSLVQRFHFRP